MEEVIDLDKIRQDALSKRVENRLLGKKILALSSAEADALILPLAEKAAAEIDCTSCGNCCRSLNPPLREDEIERVANAAGVDPHTFPEEFLHRNPHQPYFFIKSRPCLFLKDCKCSIYDQRPDSCADYPHLSSPGQKFRFGKTLEQYGICPIVHRVVEELKSAL